MSDYYFEFNDDQWKSLNLPGPYVFVSSLQDREMYRYYPQRWMLAANRIWSEMMIRGEPRVYFVKNRFRSKLTLDENDLREFAWIKLSAHRIYY